MGKHAGGQRGWAWPGGPSRSWGDCRCCLGLSPWLTAALGAEQVMGGMRVSTGPTSTWDSQEPTAPWTLPCPPQVPAMVRTCPGLSAEVRAMAGEELPEAKDGAWLSRSPWAHPNHRSGGCESCPVGEGQDQEGPSRMPICAEPGSSSVLC